MIILVPLHEGRATHKKIRSRSPPSLALGHSAYNHQDEAGGHGDRHFGFNR